MAETSTKHKQAQHAVRILTGQINARVAELRRKERTAKGAQKRALQANIQLLEDVKQIVQLAGWGGGGTGIARCLISL